MVIVSQQYNHIRPSTHTMIIHPRRMCSVAKTVVRKLSRLSGVLIRKLIALQVAREPSVRDGSTTGVPVRVVMMIE
jgi:hypothetical protein